MIADMPRGGPDASCLDRLLQTNGQEYLDRDDIGDDVKRDIVAALDRFGTMFRPAAVEKDEFHCGTRQFHRGRAARDGRPAVLARIG
ncbi:hypothetical protein MSAR_12250 [Mycolicibacterium sarraceniae]|uniref:Uncharacterized protein n=1 Tax=Mycolicibacterium sarraceniae TaxID=1534348 RepID=A0A7I7SPE6_9MYCO|nr:hypothetical protein MSAR_12250 [Mycolicibacterium sarraceniae]